MRHVALAALLACAAAAPLRAQQTRPERTDYRETSSYADVMAFLDSLRVRGAAFREGTIGRSPEGKPIPYLILSRPLVTTPGEAARSGKPVVYIQANIHAGEVEGKEAAQMLVRDLTLGALRPLLDSLVLIVVPIYNTDGNDHFAPGEVNRPGQNGPALVGTRANGQGFDLNRDYVKLEAPETRGSLDLINRWDPDVFLDLHTTDGSYHGYRLTYSPGLNPNSPPTNDYVRDWFLPKIRERVRQRHHEEMFWYGNFRNQDPDSLTQGWETYDPRPRFGTNLFGMRGRLSILSEAYSNDDLRTRVTSTYDFVHEILSLLAEDRARVKTLVAAADRYHPDSVTVRSVMAPATMQDVIAELTQPAGEGGGPYARRKRTGIFKTIRMPVFDRFAPARKEALPEAYLLPAQFSDIVALLRAQGIAVGQLTAPWHGDGETFRLDSVSAVPYVFEGHREVTLTGQWAAHPGLDAPAGWYVVSTRQPLGLLAAYLLEPASEDGYAAWNFLDRALRRGHDYPFLRVRTPVTTPRLLVP
ncbi:MAG TPA: M14 family metallopeptidase [Gemmatimonadales bacterium]|nr:M14 family metallopeptidase [Gemmatimonadales bacterium]